MYNIVCDSLSLTPRPNNGTIRLPFKPTGLHTPDQSVPAPDESFLTTSSGVVSSSPSPSIATSKEEVDHVISISPIEATPASESDVVGIDEPRPSSPINVEKPSESGKVEVSHPGAETDRPTVSDEGSKKGSFGDWLKAQIEKMKGWIDGLVDGKKDGEKKVGQ